MVSDVVVAAWARQRVSAMLNTNQSAGNYKYAFGGYGIGVYYVRLVVNDKISIMKMVEL